MENRAEAREEQVTKKKAGTEVTGKVIGGSGRGVREADRQRG